MKAKAIAMEECRGFNLSRMHSKQTLVLAEPRWTRSHCVGAMAVLAWNCAYVGLHPYPPPRTRGAPRRRGSPPGGVFGPRAGRARTSAVQIVEPIFGFARRRWACRPIGRLHGGGLEGKGIVSPQQSLTSTEVAVSSVHPSGEQVVSGHNSMRVPSREQVVRRALVDPQHCFYRNRP